LEVGLWRSVLVVLNCFKLLDISYQEVLAKFDKLVEAGVVHYVAPTVRTLNDDGYVVWIFLLASMNMLIQQQIEYLISDTLTTKPQSEGTLRSHEDTAEHEPAQRPHCFGPGSDIAFEHPDLLLSTVNSTHLLVINKFCVCRPQMLLLATDSYRRQYEPLSAGDLEAAWTVLFEFEGPHYVMYNCTSKAGASRQHKHMHIIPYRRYPDSGLFGQRVSPEYLRDLVQSTQGILGCRSDTRRASCA